MKKNVFSLMENSIFDLFSTEEVEAMCVAQAVPIDAGSSIGSNEVVTVVKNATVFEQEPAERDYTEEEEEENYLCREERILSLAKEKLDRLERDYALTTLEELLMHYFHTDSKKDMETELADTFRSILKNADDEILISLSTYFSIPGKRHFVIEEVVEEGEKDRIYRHLSSTYRRTKPRLFRILFSECGYRTMVIYGTSLKLATARGQRGCIWNDGVYDSKLTQCDLGIFFERLYTFQIGFEQWVKDASALLTTVEPVKDAVELFSLLSTGSFDKELYNEEVILDSTITERESLVKLVTEFLNQFSFVKLSDMSRNCYNQELNTARRLRKENIVKKVPFLLTKGCLTRAVRNPVFVSLYPDVVSSYACVHNYIECWGGDYYWPLIHSWVLPDEFSCILKEYLQKREEVHRYVKELRTKSSSYARSYETKKNIPKKTLLAMENSVLNGYFGYVEFDEMCDLKKADELSKECIALLDSFFSFVRKDTKNNSIRFRRLGNHKAAGLYYPGLQCLCVDVGSPSSFVHELGHLIDYTEQYSLKGDFNRVLREYCYYIDSLTKEETKFFTKKYGRDYYTNPTEVFARSFELYVTEKLGVKNSLVSSEYGVVYPLKNELLMEKIFGYFDALMVSLKENVKEEVSADEGKNICANIG